MIKFYDIYVFIFQLCAVPAFALAPTPGQKLSWEEALEQIVDRNPAHLIEKTLLQTSEARLRAARWSFAPDLKIHGYIQSNSYAAAPSLLPGDLSYGATSKSADLVATLNLFRMGADWAGTAASEKERQSQEFKVSASALKAEDEAARSLISWTQSSLETRVLQEIVHSRSELLGIAQQRYQQGLLAMQEVNAVSVDLQNAESKWRDSQVDTEKAQNQLVSALGNLNVDPHWPWKDRIRSSDSKKLIDSTSLLQDVPDWLAGQSAVDASLLRYRQSVRLLFPSIDLAASYGRGILGDPSGSTWGATFTITLPLFERFEGYTRAAIQSGNRSIAEFNLEQIQRDVVNRWTTSRAGFKILLDSADRREKTLELSRKIYEDNLKRFRGGRVSANDLLIDENRLFDSELLAIRGWSAVHVVYMEVCHSLGRRVKNCR